MRIRYIVFFLLALIMVGCTNGSHHRFLDCNWEIPYTLERASLDPLEYDNLHLFGLSNDYVYKSITFKKGRERDLGVGFPAVLPKPSFHLKTEKDYGDLLYRKYMATESKKNNEIRNLYTTMLIDVNGNYIYVVGLDYDSQIESCLQSRVARIKRK